VTVAPEVQYAPSGDLSIAYQVVPGGTVDVERDMPALGGGEAEHVDVKAVAELTGVRAMIETYPLEKAAEAYARMLSGQANFRVVLTM